LQESPDEEVSKGQTVTSKVSSHLQVSIQVLHALQELLFGVVRHQLLEDKLQPLINLNLGSASCFSSKYSNKIYNLPQRLPGRCFRKGHVQGTHALSI